MVSIRNTSIKKRKKEKKLTINLDILPHHRPLCLILLVQRDLDHLLLSISTTITTTNGPTTHLPNKVFHLLAMHIQPALQRIPINLSVGLADRCRDPHAHQLLKAADISHQIGIQIVAVKRLPETSVVGTLEQILERVEFLDGFVQGSIACGWVRGGCGGGGGRVESEDV